MRTHFFSHPVDHCRQNEFLIRPSLFGRYCILTNDSDHPRPALKAPGYQTSPVQTGWPDGCGVVLRGTSAPGGPQADGQNLLERFNNRCVSPKKPNFFVRLTRQLLHFDKCLHPSPPGDIAPILALGIAIIAGFFCYEVRLYFFPEAAGDYSWALFMAEDLLAGRDPYNFIPSAILVPYPLPVVIFGFPLLWLPYKFAAATFFGLSSGLLAYGILRSDKPWRLLTFVSLPYVYALLFVQWAPLIMATWFFPILAPTLVLVKPQTALPVALNRLTRNGIIIAGVILLLSLIIYPTWPFRWYAMTRDFEYVIPFLALPLGPLLLGSAIFWKRPEARVLFISAFLPFRGAYDLLPLWLVPQSWKQMAFLTAIPWIAGILWPKIVFTMLKSPAVVPILLIPSLIVLVWDVYQKNPRFWEKWKKA